MPKNCGWGHSGWVGVQRSERKMKVRGMWINISCTVCEKKRSNNLSCVPIQGPHPSKAEFEKRLHHSNRTETTKDPGSVSFFAPHIPGFIVLMKNHFSKRAQSKEYTFKFRYQTTRSNDNSTNVEKLRGLKTSNFCEYIYVFSYVTDNVNRYSVSPSFSLASAVWRLWRLILDKAIV